MPKGGGGGGEWGFLSSENQFKKNVFTALASKLNIRLPSCFNISIYRLNFEQKYFYYEVIIENLYTFCTLGLLKRHSSSIFLVQLYVNLLKKNNHFVYCTPSVQLTWKFISIKKIFAPNLRLLVNAFLMFFVELIVSQKRGWILPYIFKFLWSYFCTISCFIFLRSEFCDCVCL